MTYRADIDGLRAVAVLSVLLYHLGFRGFPGGFVGVDVFFVISGFLITGIIKADLERQAFSFSHFYARRARRLLPAMFVTILLCALAAIILFAPDHLAAFATSARGAALGYSNIQFWMESDYFDISARLKPLLHTWSLSVEWQFYAVWPAFIAVCFAAWRRGLPWLILIAGLLSLAANIAFQDGSAAFLSDTALGPYLADGRSTLFYNMPFRIFEFTAGAMLLWLNPRRTDLVAEILLAAGLLAIAYAVVFYRATMLFNPLNPLLPCIGAAVVLYAGQARFTGRLLRNPLSAYIGRISYSVYLMHWPLIVFTEYYQFGPLTRRQAVVLAALAIVLGAAMHHTIESPFRRGKASFFRYAALAIGVCLVATLIVPVGRLTAERFAPGVDRAAAGQRLKNAVTNQSKEAFGSIGCEKPCEFGTAGVANVLIVGDSHVDHFTKALDMLAGSKTHFLLMYSPACFFGAVMSNVSPTSELITRRCREARATLDAWQKSKTYSAIVVGQLWSGYQQQLYKGDVSQKYDSLDQLYDAMLQDIGKRFAGFPGRIVFIGRAPDTNLGCYDRPRYLEMTCPPPGLDEFPVFRRAFDRFAASTDLDVVLVDPVDTICPQEDCRLADKDGHVLYTDLNHLSVYGALEIAPKILKALGIESRKTASRP